MADRAEAFRPRSTRVACLVLTLGILGTSWGGSSSEAVAQPLRESRTTGMERPATSVRRVGRLTQSVAVPGTATTYELRDLLGIRRQVVVAEGDLDLAPYAGRRVALFGRLGFDGASSIDAFLVHRVIDLNGGDLGGGLTAPVVPLEQPVLAVPQEAEQESVLELVAFEEGVPPDVMPEEIPVPSSPEDPPVVLDDVTIPDEVILPPDGEVQLWDPTIVAEPNGGMLGRAWFRGEYLLWWTDDLRLPPLVTASPVGTARTEAGVLGETGTSILYGNAGVNGGPQSGGRFRGGWWLIPEYRLGLEGEYLWLGQQEDAFLATSDGSEILARPFFDILNGQETAELVSFPDVIRGTVSVRALTDLQSAGIWFRKYSCGSFCDACGDPCNPCCAPPSNRTDYVVGYRYMQLKDDLVIREDLVSLDTSNPGSFEIEDSFATSNTFHGVELGVIHEGTRGPYSLELLGKIALGNNRQEAVIRGFSTITESGVAERYRGGLLAQRTNIGTHRQDVFSVLPQLSATLGWRVTSHLRLTAGYTLLYLSNVLRAGDQIDLDVNPNLLPPQADPFSGALRPEFVFRESDFWAHGLSFGGDVRW